MDQRGDIRYSLEDAVVLRRTVGDIRCRFEFDPELEANLVDLSLRGFGYRIDAVGASQVEEIKSRGNFLVTMMFGTESIAADVRNVWSNVFFEGGTMKFTGGVALEVLSPEDRLKLERIIETIRGGR